MKNIDLTAIETRAENAMPGPWTVKGSYEDGATVMEPSGFPLPGCMNCGENDAIYEIGDAEFIAHARQDIPELLAHIRELEARLAQ